MTGATDRETAPIGMPRQQRSGSHWAAWHVPSGNGCRECGAVYDRGRWLWNATPRHDAQLVCHACKRIIEHAHGAELELQGCAYLRAHRAAIMHLLRLQARIEAYYHPSGRPLRIDEDANGLRVTVCCATLLRRLGEALLNAHLGRFSIEYREGDELVRACWTRASDSP
ncbi:BCAM0308 family protein [Burkholderia gladioli]|uniref:BCAM0308 family protein n=1 Tax=Burkholderia gladioli TaxID=28095 RepID=UPI001640859C|nr:BCAM0308 family protein [Burkholderia gladioli]